MSIRRAAYTDIPRIVELLADGHKRSRYNGTGVGLDIQCTKALLMSAIQRHDGTGEGATHVVVSERIGFTQTGVLYGMRVER